VWCSTVQYGTVQYITDSGGGLPWWYCWTCKLHNKRESLMWIHMGQVFNQSPVQES